MVYSQGFQIFLVVSLAGFWAANVDGVYVIPYGFDSLMESGSNVAVTTMSPLATTTEECTETAEPTTTPTPTTPSTTRRICTKCLMKRTSTTDPPTTTSTTTTTTTTTTPKPTTTTTTTTTPKPTTRTTTTTTTTTPKPTPKPTTTTTTTTTTTKKPTTKPPTTTSTTTTTTKKPTTTKKTTTTTTTRRTTTPAPAPTAPPTPKRPDEGFNIKYYHQYNYYYPEGQVPEPKSTKSGKIQANVYIKNVPKAVVPIAENVYMSESCDGEKAFPKTPTTAAPAPAPRPHVPSYMSYVPQSYSPPADYAPVTSDSLDQMYQLPEPALPIPQYDPRWRNQQVAPINSIRKDIVTYLSDPNVLTPTYTDASATGVYGGQPAYPGYEGYPVPEGYQDYSPVVPASYSPYSDYMAPCPCQQSMQQAPSSAPVYSYTM